MKVLLPTVGSAGDVHPFLAIGLAMQARSHSVEIMTNPIFADLVRQTGLGFHPVGTIEHGENTYKSPKLWHPVHGLGVFWRRMARYAIEPVYERIAHHAKTSAAGGRCVVLATPLMLGARLAQEKLGVPLVTAYTAATMLRSCEDPLTLAHWRVPRWMPRIARAAAWRALDSWKLHPMVAADLSLWRERLALPVLRQSVFGQWIHSPGAGVTLFPPWFAPASIDWPAHVKQAGFPLYDGDTKLGMDAGLMRFLAQGAPPIVFTLGSAMSQGGDFFRAALRSCEALGRRGVLLASDPGQVPVQLPPSVFHCNYAPFGLLLLRAAALVHHGGVGTTAQGLRAGLPQLLVPLGFDQFDNAMRLELLGVGASVPRQDTQLDSLTPLLRDLLGSARVAEACRSAAANLKVNTALDVICDTLESAQ
jgi:rhamnosyltransferase subunit B